MSLVNNLLNSAAIIRDATQEGENTALRVGGFLVSLIQAIVNSLPDKVVDGDVIDTQSTDTSFIITLRTKDSDGHVGTQRVTIPAASTATAGLMTSSDRSDLTKAIYDATQALLKANQSIDDAADAKRDAADAISRINGLLALIGANNGIAPLDAVGRLPIDNLPESVSTMGDTVANHTHQLAELYADSASQQANIADHTSKLTELYEATGSLWANIDDLKGVDAVQASKIADLETGSTNFAAAIQAVRETAEGAQTSANANAAAIDSLLGANASTAIENFNEIIQFLDGIKDDEQLIGFLNELKTADSETASLIATHTTQIEALQSTAAEHDQQLAELATDAAAQRVCNEEHDTRISSLEERQSDCVWVLPFAFIFDSSPTEGSTVDFSLAAAPSESEIVFDLATNCFYAYTSALSMVDGAPQAIHTLYMKWDGCERYQRDGEPRRDCIYVSEENRLYRFDGATFALVGSSLEIGTVSGTAFDGARGEALESAVGALTTQVADNTSQVADHAAQLSQQFVKLGEIETAADAMQTAIEALQGVDVDHQQQINEALRDIDTVKGNVNGHDSRITALEGMQNDIAEIRQLVEETKSLAEQVLGASQGYNHEWIEAQ